MQIAVLCSRVRVEEKLLFCALRERDVEFDAIDVRRLALDVARNDFTQYDAVLIRCLSHSRAFYLSRWLKGLGVRTVNRHESIAVCGDKLLTSFAFQEAGLPIPRTEFAFDSDAMIEAVEAMGYPVVFKPLHGSWGRLLAKANDRCAVEALLEHKKTLGGYAHAIFYAQEYVSKPGRDIRALVVGDDVIYAVWRSSDHWITNTATGGETAPCPLTDEIRDLSLRAALAVGGDVVAVDLLETGDGRILVNEVNHTPEFHGALEVTDVDIAGRMIDFVLRVTEEHA